MRTILLLAVLFIFYVGCAATPGTNDPVLGGVLSADARIAGDIMHPGFPGTGRVLYREGYVVSYDGRNRVPSWVGERLNAKRLRSTEPGKPNRFGVDEDLPAAVRSRSSDFKGSGYIRGRLASAFNHRRDLFELKQTYLLSNVAPQIGEQFRKTFWIKFEEQVRAWARESDDLYVYTGPLYVPVTGEDGKRYVHYEVIGANNVAVPTHFFKVMLRVDDGKMKAQAFVVPHQAFEGQPRYSDYLVTVDEVERLSGLDFFDEYSANMQRRLEGKKAAAAWGEGSGDSDGCSEKEGCGDGCSETKADGCGG